MMGQDESTSMKEIYARYLQEQERVAKKTLKMIAVFITAIIMFWILSPYLSLTTTDVSCNTNATFWAVFTLLLLALIVLLDTKLLRYRISKGKYGENEEESREIIRYILKQK